MQRTHRSSLITHHARSGFTLVELVVVIAIIALLLAVAIPAMGPLFSQNHSAQAINTLNGLITTAQTLAEADATPVAIRIERAFRLKPVQYNNQPYEAMRMFYPSDPANDQPEYFDYQQARLVRFTSQPPPPGLAAGNEPYQPAFEQLRDRKVVALPKSAWLAPIECIDLNAAGQPVVDPYSPSNRLWRLDDAGLAYQPRRVRDVLDPSITNPGADPNAAAINRLDTFYIVFDRFGGLQQMRTSPTEYRTHYWFRDLTQPYEDPNPPAGLSNPPAVYPLVDHPDASARGVLVYDRQRFMDLPNTDGGAADISNPQTRRGLLMKSRPVYVSRSLGALVEGRQ